MVKEITTFGDIETTEKDKFHCYKKSFFLEDLDIVTY